MLRTFLDKLLTLVSCAASHFLTPKTLCRYTGKLREDLDTFSREVFVLASDRERIQSILQDLNKTARDFAGIGGRAVEQMSTLLVGRAR